MENVSITCPACGHTAAVSPEHASGALRCGECGVRHANGRLPARVVLEPFVADHRKWVRVRLQDPVTKRDAAVAELDPEYAILVAKELLGMVV